MKCEAQIAEFPFVAEMPKREKSKLVKVWELFEQVKREQERVGVLVHPVHCAALLGVCRQRVYQLIQDGRLERIDFGGHQMITERSMLKFCASERKAGRPCLPENAAEMVKRTWRVARAKLPKK